MRRNGISNFKKERIIMIASSAFVLAALTMTGIYMNQDNKASIDDGYTVDFGALENTVDEKMNQIALNQEEADSVGEEDNTKAGAGMDRVMGSVTQSDQDSSMQVALYDDLDYTPIEMEEDAAPVDSALVENAVPEPEPEAEDAPADQAVSGSQVVVEQELHFTGEAGLHVPVYGEVLMPYNMDSSVYFQTLNQYRRNPATLYSSVPDTEVFACAKAKVENIYSDSKLGNVLVLDLGDGYQAIYGQLKNIQVSNGAYVEEGQVIAEVENPTKYYIEEGCNLYFELRKDGEAVNPEEFF